MRIRAWLAAGGSLLCGGLLFACSGSSSDEGPPEVPPPNLSAPTAQVNGTWLVDAKFVSGTGTCSTVVGTAAQGRIMIRQTGSSVTVEDQSGTTASGTVQGNTLEFTYAAMGITQAWSVVVYADNTLLSGQIDVNGQGCTSMAEVTGGRPSFAHAPGPDGAGAPPPPVLGPGATTLQPGEAAIVALPDGSHRIVTAEVPGEAAFLQLRGAAGGDPLGPSVQIPGVFASLVEQHATH